LVNHSTSAWPGRYQSGSLIRGASKNVSTPDIMIRLIDPGSLPLVNQSAPSDATTIPIRSWPPLSK